MRKSVTIRRSVYLGRAEQADGVRADRDSKLNAMTCMATSKEHP